MNSKKNKSVKKKTVECSVDGCDRDAQTRGWCPSHYAWWKAKGETPTHVLGSRTKSAPVATVSASSAGGALPPIPTSVAMPGKSTKDPLRLITLALSSIEEACTLLVERGPTAGHEKTVSASIESLCDSIDSMRGASRRIQDMLHAQRRKAFKDAVCG